MIVTTANNAIEASIGDSNGIEKNIPEKNTNHSDNNETIFPISLKFRKIRQFFFEI